MEALAARSAVDFGDFYATTPPRRSWPAKPKQVAAGIRGKATHQQLGPARRANADTCADYLVNKAAYLDYTWDWTRLDPAAESSWIEVEQEVERIRQIAGPLVVITGGEPMLQQHQLTPLVRTCRADGRAVEIETNGTVTPSDALLADVTRFNVSAKLSNARLPAERRIRPDPLRVLAGSGTAILKFVVEQAQARFGLEPIWIMPQATDASRVVAVMQDLADEVLARSWNLGARLAAVGRRPWPLSRNGRGRAVVRLAHGLVSRL